MTGINYSLDTKTLNMVGGSTAGAQPKYYNDGYFYKLDHGGKQGYSEYLASVVLSCSNIDNYVTYEQCTINNRPGCRSRNFLGREDVLYSLETLYMIYTGKSISDEIALLPDAQTRLDFLVTWIGERTGLDLTEYFAKMLSLDMLIVNTDRHFHNIGIICNPEEGTFREAPIFDNGEAFLCTAERTLPTIEENISSACSRTISGNFEIQAVTAGLKMELDYTALEKKLCGEPPSYTLRVLRHQLEKYRDYIPDRKMSKTRKTVKKRAARR